MFLTVLVREDGFTNRLLYQLSYLGILIDFNIAAKKVSNIAKILCRVQCEKGYISQPIAIPTAKNFKKQDAAYFTRSNAVLFVNPASAMETSRANKHIAEK
jgi:hypothetical protein